MFHAIVGHYVGCGWEADRIFDHLQQHPQGIGERYLAEDRLRGEIERSAGKYAKSELPPWSDSWMRPKHRQNRRSRKSTTELEDDELKMMSWMRSRAGPQSAAALRTRGS